MRFVLRHFTQYLNDFQLNPNLSNYPTMQTLPKSTWIKTQLSTAKQQVENDLFTEMFSQPPAIKTPSASKVNRSPYISLSAGVHPSFSQHLILSFAHFFTSSQGRHGSSLFCGSVKFRWKMVFGEDVRAVIKLFYQQVFPSLSKDYSNPCKLKNRFTEVLGFMCPLEENKYI